MEQEHKRRKAKEDRRHTVDGLLFLVGVAGFEPAASWTRTMRDTKLRHTPITDCHLL